ncbi:MAG: signal peptide peptidase SppA [Flavobacteriia bacterium]|nr:signal peptide peptidase SppA [Flavobacteriia bacterium]
MSENRVSFGRIFWPSLIAAFIVSILGFLIFILTTFGIIGSLIPETKKVNIESGVLHLTLEGEIKDKTTDEFDPYNLSFNQQLSIPAILNGLEYAQKDPSIKGVFFEIKGWNFGMASAKEIRSALTRFQASGKFVVAYLSGEVLTQKQYYVASACNEIYGFPNTMMEFVGLGTELMFFKNTLDKLGIEVQVFRGNNNDFKSAVEPFFRSEMSDSARVQVNRYLKSIWIDLKLDISKSRKIPVEKLESIAELMQIKRIDDAVKLGLVDKALYKDEVLSLIRKKVKIRESKELIFTNFDKYAIQHFIQKQAINNKNKANIAVVVAEGEISTNDSELTSEKICKYLREIRHLDNIKTLVLRVNSPGGSALASDEIWREIEICKKTKKIIVSMGDVAASGGYYISAPAHTIFAQANTITGSIGVFGVIPFTEKMFSDKLGITFDRASTNSHSVMSTNRKLSPYEAELLQEEIDFIYSDFLEKVADGRKMTTQQVNVLARGRVWTGVDAQKYGLVDRLGGLNDAIEFAVKDSGIKDAKIVYFPKVEENPFQAVVDLIEDQKKEKVSVKKVQIPSNLTNLFTEVEKIQKMKGIQMRLPLYFPVK